MGSTGPALLRDARGTQAMGRALQTEGLARIHQFHPLALLLLTFPPTKLRLQKSNQISEGTGCRSQVSEGVGQAPFLSAKSKSSQTTKSQTIKISGGREGEKEVCLMTPSSSKELGKLGPGSFLDLFPYWVGTIRGPPNTTKFKMYPNQLKSIPAKPADQAGRCRLSLQNSLRS